MSTDALLREIREGEARAVYLFHGEEFLARKAAQAVVDALVDPSLRDLNLSISDGASVAEVVRELSTLPMFAGTKVVWLQEPAFLAPKRAPKADQLGRLQELWEQGKRREAARRLLALAQKAGLDPATAAAADWRAEAGLAEDPPSLLLVAHVRPEEGELGVREVGVVGVAELARLVDERALYPRGQLRRRREAARSGLYHLARRPRQGR